MRNYLKQWPLLFSAVCLSAISIIYELSYCKIISKFTGSPVEWEALGMGAFLLGMGFGAIILEERKKQDTAPNLSTVEFILSIFGVSFPVALYVFHIFYRINYFDGGILALEDSFQRISIFAAFALIFPFLIGLFSGMELPLLIDKSASKKSFPVLMGCYYFGALVGTLAFHNILKSNVSDLELGCYAASINCAFFMWFRFKEKTLEKSYISITVLPAIIIYVSMIAPNLEMAQIKNFYFNVFTWEIDFTTNMSFETTVNYSKLPEYLANFEDVERHRSFYHDIDIIKFKKNDKEAFQVFIDARFQFGNESDKEYHEYMAHVPMMFNDKKVPKKVLVLGGGDGILTKELLRHSGIKSITLVDIDKTMLGLSHSHPLFLKMNHGSLKDKRVTVIREDAFVYLSKNRDKYDSIYMDFTFPFSFDVARLYSVEFLSMVSKNLKENGQFIHSTPFPQTLNDDPKLPFYDRLIASTYGRAGLKSILMFSDKQNSFLIATNSNKKWSEKHSNLGLDFKTNTKEVFEEQVYRYIPESIEREMTNSLFKPIFMGLRDRHF